MATHSSVLAWRIPGTEEPGGLPSMGSHRVGHDWCDLAVAAAGGPKILHFWQALVCGQNFWTTLWVQASPGTPCGRGYFRISESSLWVQNVPSIYVRSAKDFWWWAFRGTALWDRTRACSPKATTEKGKHIPRRALCIDVPTPTYAWAVCTCLISTPRLVT